MIQSIIGTAIDGDFTPPNPPWPSAVDPGGAVYEVPGSAGLGFWRRDYSGYYFADDIAGLLSRGADSAVADSVAQVNNPGGQNYTLMWTGYLQAPATGAFKFMTMSDDSSWFWIGSDALSPNAGNADINNGGLHGLTSVESAPVLLQSGYYYPIRAIFGQETGADNFYLSWNQQNTQYNYVNMAYSRYNSANPIDGF